MKRILAVGRKPAGACAYIVQVPARVEYGPVTSAAWADLPPVEGHGEYMKAYAQAEATPGDWRIVKTDGRTLRTVTSSKEIAA